MAEIASVDSATLKLWMEDTKKADILLRLLWKGVMDRHDHLRRVVERMGREVGVRKLPEEILRRIFEIGYDSTTRHPESLISISQAVHHDDKFIRDISHVCRDFRAIVLGCHRFWSTLSTAQSIDEINMFLERSGNSGLTIVMEEYHDKYEGQKTWEKILKTFFAHHERWEAVVWHYQLASQYRHLEKLLKKHVKSLPKLRELDIRMERTHGDDIPFDMELWHAPNLQTLYTITIGMEIPPDEFHMFQNVVNLSITCLPITMDSLFVKINAGALTNLKKLRIVLKAAGKSAPRNVQDQVILPYLEDLSFDMHYNTNIRLLWSFLTPLLTFLNIKVIGWSDDHLPAIEAPDLKFVDIDSNDITFWYIPFLLEQFSAYNRIREITIRASVIPYDIYDKCKWPNSCDCILATHSQPIPTLLPAIKFVGGKILCPAAIQKTVETLKASLDYKASWKLQFIRGIFSSDSSIGIKNLLGDKATFTSCSVVPDVVWNIQNNTSQREWDICAED